MKPLRVLLPVLIILAACSRPAGDLGAQPLPEATRRVPTDAGSMKQSFAPVVRKASPAVVNVFARRVVRQQVDPFWGLFGGGVPRERVQQSLGSGAVVRSDGVVLTNHHNIEGAQEIMVVTADRREWPATVLLDDPRADLAVLKIETKGERLPTIAIDDSEAVQVGDLVLAIGNPFGVGLTVTNGIVSALARTETGISDYSSFIQTDAAINPGNSGGPLVDMDGDLVGVNTAILSRSGTSSGVGFAIPAAVARQVVSAALGGGHVVVRPWLGAKTQGVTAEIARSMGLSTPQGVVVTDVWPGGPAARAGLGQGDVIAAVDGQAVYDEGALTYRIGGHRPGDSVPLTVRRNGGAERSLPVRVDAPPSNPAPDEKTVNGRNPLGGATVVNLSPATAYAIGLDPFAGRGVLVTQVGQGYAQTIGLQRGDFIREINGQPVATTADLARIVTSGARAWTVTIERDGRRITAQFRA